MAITFGTCLPAVCSVDLLEPIINKLIADKVGNVSLKWNSARCQMEENYSELKTIDKITL